MAEVPRSRLDESILSGTVDQAFEVLAIGAILGGMTWYVLQRISPGDSLATREPGR
jgi:hypothetical protein